MRTFTVRVASMEGGVSLYGCRVKMTEKNIEYQSLLRFADDLTQLIQHNVVSVSSKLFAKGLVAKDVHDSVLSVDGASNQSKAAKILSCVLDKIKESGDRCQYFIDVLGEDSYFDDIVLKLTKVRGKHKIGMMYKPLSMQCLCMPPTKTVCIQLSKYYYDVSGIIATHYLYTMCCKHQLVPRRQYLKCWVVPTSGIAGLQKLINTTH